MIRDMQLMDVKKVALIHTQSFPGFFLSFLGPGFLEVYYRGICRAEHSIRLVAEDDQGQIIGFVVGTASPQGFYQKLLRRDWYKFILASLNAVLHRPGIVMRLMRAATHPSKHPIDEDIVGLFSIGVHLECQRSGVGGKLLSAFLEKARQANCKKVYLSTDAVDNEKANEFYKKHGFVIKWQFKTPEGRLMNEYWLSL
ncbi:MAG: GNAT family N-acetyltransferase [Negativicutes bacterium]|nr:GNAT family N-acetyltransferase [Negativicutes bacterium]